MDAFEAVRTLLATRQFKDTPVPVAVVDEIVEAAHLSASASNAQPWHFIVVQEKGTLAKLGAIAKTGPYVAQAPLAIIAAADASSGNLGLSDVSRAIQSMMVVAWSRGVASNWVGFSSHGSFLNEVNALLSIPDGVHVLAIVPFGYPVVERKGGKKRKPIDEVVSRERYGQPFR